MVGLAGSQGRHRLAPQLLVAPCQDREGVRVGAVLERVAAGGRSPGRSHPLAVDQAGEVVEVGALLAAFELDAHLGGHVALEQEQLGFTAMESQLAIGDLMVPAEDLPPRLDKGGIAEILIDDEMPHEAVLERLDLLLQFSNRRVSLRGIHGHRLGGNLGKRKRDAAVRAVRKFFRRVVEGGRRRNIALQDSVQDLAKRLVPDGRVQGEYAVKDGAQ